MNCALCQTHYTPEADGFVCETSAGRNLQSQKPANRFTRALYGSHSDWRLETSDNPVFAIVKKGYHRHLRFRAGGVPLDSTDDCRSAYVDGQRNYVLKDRRWGELASLEVQVVACPDRMGGVWRFRTNGFDKPVLIEARMCEIANPNLHRNGDIGADKPSVFEAAPGERRLERYEWTSPLVTRHSPQDSYFVIDSINRIVPLPNAEAAKRFAEVQSYNRQIANRIRFETPDPYINALGSALAFAADGDWDGQTWLPGCIGWRMPLTGWRAAYVGDILGWHDRQRSHFDAYAKSQVTNVEPVIPHPTQDSTLNLARAEKRWGTQMYSNGYICRNPGRNDQMHHYDMNLIYIDELLWHFQYDADTAYMRRMWPVITSHLAWEKRNFDPDGDHLYDAYCCIWASDALYYNGGAVTHSSAYNYRANKLAARIAEILGENPNPYAQEAEAILKTMNERLWMTNKGVWAEYQDAMGLRRLHESPAVWSVYTPIDCGACTPEQAYKATSWVSANIPKIRVADTGYQTIATSNWMPYSWSINNVAAAEVMHTALAYFEAGQESLGYWLMKANILDQMYYGQSPANFGQISQYDAARGECYRDFGDCIGISSRTLIQGLFGIVPQALNGRCIIRPGFPNDWDSVSIKTPYLSYTYTRKGEVERYEITQNFRQPLKIVIRQNCGLGNYVDTEGTAEQHQVIEVVKPDYVMRLSHPKVGRSRTLGLDEPNLLKPSFPQTIDKYFNARVDDIFKNKYLSPRPQATTLQIPVQGIGEWCHPEQTADINDSVFRSLIVNDRIEVAGIPFRTPNQGPNIVYTSLWDNYPDCVTIPLNGYASTAYLLMAGSTNHMQSHIDNGLVVVTYTDNTSDTLQLYNPYNWCPIEQDYYIDGRAFRTVVMGRPLRVCLGIAADIFGRPIPADADSNTARRPLVSRDLGTALGFKGVEGRYIPGGAAQILSMPLNPQKQLRSLTLRTLSNDVVIGLMAVSLQ